MLRKWHHWTCERCFMHGHAGTLWQYEMSQAAPQPCQFSVQYGDPSAVGIWDYVGAPWNQFHQAHGKRFQGPWPERIDSLEFNTIQSWKLLNPNPNAIASGSLFDLYIHPCASPDCRMFRKPGKWLESKLSWKGVPSTDPNLDLQSICLCCQDEGNVWHSWEGQNPKCQ